MRVIRVAAMVVACATLHTPIALAGTSTASFTSGPISSVIPGGGYARAEITVPQLAGEITDVRLGMRISSSDDGMLGFALIGPRGEVQGQVAQLGQAYGYFGTDFGSGSADCAGALTYLTDRAPNITPLREAKPPFVGTFSVAGLLYPFYEAAAPGVWTLHIGSEDEVGQNATLHCWTLDITTRVPDPVVESSTIVAGKKIGSMALGSSISGHTESNGFFEIGGGGSLFDDWFTRVYMRGGHKFSTEYFDGKIARVWTSDRYYKLAGGIGVNTKVPKLRNGAMWKGFRYSAKGRRGKKQPYLEKGGKMLTTIYLSRLRKVAVVELRNRIPYDKTGW